MTFPRSRLMSTATAAYAVFALVVPRHLGRALTSDKTRQASYDVLARTYGARDLPVCALAVFGRSRQAVTAAMLLRVVMDVSDGLVLSAVAEDEATRRKVLAVTLGWATLSASALLVDRRRALLSP